MAIAFAGPLIQLVLFGLLLLVGLWTMFQAPERNPSPILEAFYLDMLSINLLWPILNLLPIWPLDGGQISREFLGWLMPRQGVQLALGISLLVSGLLAVGCLFSHLIPFLPIGGMYTAILFGMLAVGSFMEMQRQADVRRHWDFPDEDRWENRRDRW
jgi:Zn-dependent protease